MPWWAWLYLVVVFAIYAIGLFLDEDADRVKRIISVFSLISICLCVSGFFNPTIAGFLGFLFVPIVACGLYWEFREAVRDTSKAQAEIAKDQELDDWERNALLNMGIALNAALVVPGYMFGVMLCVQLLTGGSA